MAKRFYCDNWKDYELIDAGNNQKLERWGNIITIRPETQAYFKPVLTADEWQEKAHLEFIETDNQKGSWKKLKNSSTEDWKIKYNQLTFLLSPTNFKHVGLFPEQALNWEVISQHLTPTSKMLNLFAYTGAASLVGKKTGAAVTHVDSVKQLITWARTNMDNSHLSDIRWMHEDALKFAEKEVKRENFYDLIIMDPPAWGIGAKKEKWKIEHKLESLITTAANLLNPDGLLILNTYSPRISLEDIQKYSSSLFKNIELGELWKKTNTGNKLFYGYLMHARK